MMEMSMRSILILLSRKVWIQSRKHLSQELTSDEVILVM